MWEHLGQRSMTRVAFTVPDGDLVTANTPAPTWQRATEGACLGTPRVGTTSQAFGLCRAHQWLARGWPALAKARGENDGPTTVRPHPFWLQRMRNVSCFCSWDTASRQRSTLVSFPPDLLIPGLRVDPAAAASHPGCCGQHGDDEVPTCGVRFDTEGC